MATHKPKIYNLSGDCPSDFSAWGAEWEMFLAGITSRKALARLCTEYVQLEPRASDLVELGAPKVAQAEWKQFGKFIDGLRTSAVRFRGFGWSKYAPKICIFCPAEECECSRRYSSAGIGRYAPDGRYTQTDCIRKKLANIHARLSEFFQKYSTWVGDCSSWKTYGKISAAGEDFGSFELEVERLRTQTCWVLALVNTRHLQLFESPHRVLLGPLFLWELFVATRCLAEVLRYQQHVRCHLIVHCDLNELAWYYERLADSGVSSCFEAFTACGMCGSKEAELFQCSGCRYQRYCSQKCQRLDWPGHSLDCNLPGSQLDASTPIRDREQFYS